MGDKVSGTWTSVKFADIQWPGTQCSLSFYAKVKLLHLTSPWQERNHWTSRSPPVLETIPSIARNASWSGHLCWEGLCNRFRLQQGPGPWDSWAIRLCGVGSVSVGRRYGLEFLATSRRRNSKQAFGQAMSCHRQHTHAICSGKWHAF